MNDSGSKAMPAARGALLPAGLQDLLPPNAAQEAACIERLIAAFTAQGYERAKPPLIEFEETLLTGAGAALAGQTFRLMDPVSQRMLGLRADITPQIARLAGSRLSRSPRPLRLCYAGQVLRVKGTQLRPERQFAQVGAELIGATAPAADAEVVLMAASALKAAGVERLSVDLSLPTLLDRVAQALDLPEAQVTELRQALDRKDVAAVEQAGGDEAPLFRGLLRAAGPAEDAVAKLKALDLPAAAQSMVTELADLVDWLKSADPALMVTIDPVDLRFEYQTGLSFTLYARGVRGELGRGGRYRTDAVNGASENATGFTLFMDSVLRALPAPKPVERIFLPAGSAPEVGARLRSEGWITLAGLTPVEDLEAEARHLGCSHYLESDGEVRPVAGAGSLGQATAAPGKKD